MVTFVSICAAIVAVSAWLVVSGQGLFLLVAALPAMCLVGTVYVILDQRTSRQLRIGLEQVGSADSKKRSDGMGTLVGQWNYAEPAARERILVALFDGCYDVDPDVTSFATICLSTLRPNMSSVQGARIAEKARLKAQGPQAIPGNQTAALLGRFGPDIGDASRAALDSCSPAKST